MPSKPKPGVLSGKALSVVKIKPAQKSRVDDSWDSRLGFLMHDVSRLRRGVFDEFMKPVGLTRSQWWILARGRACA